MRVDISQQQAKHLDCLRDQSFDYVITVCDRMRESYPTFPGDYESIHWSLPDPVALENISEQERYTAFEQIARKLHTQIHHFWPGSPTSRGTRTTKGTLMQKNRQSDL
jgi:protein-tyrosine-phosphatase